MVKYSDYLNYCRLTAKNGGKPISFVFWKKNQNKMKKVVDIHSAA